MASEHKDEQQQEQPADQQPARQPEGQPEGQPVNMVEEAREIQEEDTRSEVEREGIKLIAPAKVNLYLEVGGRRADGYHEVETVLHALTLHDVLYMMTKPAGEEAEEGEDAADAEPAESAEPVTGLNIDLTCVPGREIDPLEVDPEDNMAVRAVRALAARIGRAEDETVVIRLEKNIPAQGGMGGGSSDAAAALLGCANIWGLAPDDPRIEEVARGLGADVPFFLHGGCARMGGTGGDFEAALKPMGDYIVLVRPGAGMPTADSYRAFDEAPTSIDAADHESVMQAERAAEVPLRNNLAPASESLLPELAEVREWMAERAGAEAVLMAGSGSTFFARCEKFQDASRMASDARAKGWWARATTFGPVRAAVVPQD